MKKPEKEMKKRASSSLTIVLAVMLILILASFFSISGIFDNVLKSLGITGHQISGKGSYPTTYPEINITFTKNNPGNYSALWEVIENHIEWSATILWTDLNVTNASNDVITSVCTENENYPISDTAPISKLLNLNLHIKEGNLIGNCKPQCKPDIPTVPMGPGKWVDYCVQNPCANSSFELKSETPCPAPYLTPFPNVTYYFNVEPPYCCMTGNPENEGWYNITCDELTISCSILDPLCLPKYRIRLDQCEYGEYSVYYVLPSDTQTIFEQKLITTSGATSINWFTKFDFIEGNEATSGDLLEYSSVDYVSRWNSIDQKYYGSAEASIGERGASIVIGSFNLDQGKPYFASLSGGTPDSSTYLTYAGEVPSAVTFSLKNTTEGYSNLISLPLNTTIDNVTALCTSMGLTSETSAVGIWNPLTQETTSHVCGLDSTTLEPGKAYKVTDTRGFSPGKTWTQV